MRYTTRIVVCPVSPSFFFAFDAALTQRATLGRSCGQRLFISSFRFNLQM